MYPNASKFAIEAYKDATSAPYAPGDRPGTRTRRAMSSENERVSRKDAVRIHSPIKGGDRGAVPSESRGHEK